ncbi:ATP-binding protein [uncultured Fibrella sp.]|uniref:PAS domain-containing sensor histidine kinase n=1 Tax=uncultured Fibrella sp. TaxID=1284596 RepID=UPI0035CC0D78
MKPFTSADFQQAKANHLRFKSRLRAILYGETSEQESTVLSQYACEVGRWIYGRALVDYEHIPEVHELERVHASIHVVARDMVRQYHDGHVDEARRGLLTMEQIADQLVDLLQLVEEKVAGEQKHTAAIDDPVTTEATLLSMLLAQNQQLDAQIKQQVITGRQTSERHDPERQLLHDFFMQAPAAHCILRGPSHIFELANPAYQDLIGEREILGKPVREALPELEGQGFYELLDTVYTTGEPFVGKELSIFLHNAQGIVRKAYLNFIYQPIRNEQRQVEGILAFAYEVTEQILARDAIAESEAKFRALIEEAPIATCLLVGAEMVIEIANDTIMNYWGKGPSVIGKPLLEAVPELKGQATMQRLAKGYETGQAYSVRSVSGQLEKEGMLKTYFFDTHYKPIRNTNGDVYALVVMGIDVTEQVVTQQKLEASQTDLIQTNQRLNLALDAGRLGTYELDLATGLMTCSDQCKRNYGQPTEDPFNFPDLLRIIIDADRARVEQTIHNALTTQTTYYAEYRITWPDNSLHWVKASGLGVYAADGQAVKITGVTQDITARRMAQEELEQQVQQRTQQIQESNQDLLRSNENLQQFAYVASHDLQEPLRKIQAFGDLLQTQYGDQIGEGVAHLERMQSAANRMSTLIRDLLAFSRISTRQEATSGVSLNQVIHQVLTDLDFQIRGAEADIEVTQLPDVLGDKSQLSQLFQNLLSNALKFHKVGERPQIRVSAQLVRLDALPTSVKPTRKVATYQHITVTDNGIGFDEKYLSRIFQVFQRLHSKSEYAGTGVGLAICEKVAANHGGAITASSEPGRGATFHVYFPA